MLILELLFLIITNFILIFFLGRKFEWKEGINRAERVIVVIIYISLSVCVSYLTARGDINYSNSEIITVLGMWFYLYLVKKGTRLEHVYWTTLIHCISSSATITSLLIIRLAAVKGIFTYPGLNLDIVLSGFLMIVEYVTLSSVTKYSPNLKYLGFWALIFSILVNIFWSFVIRILSFMVAPTIGVVASSTIILSYIVYFLIMDLLSKNINKLLAIEMDYQNMTLKSKYYEEVELINQEVRKYRHDLANHLNMLYYLIDTNNSEDSKRYIESMAVDLKKIHKGFYYIETGNKVVDFILNSKLLVARENGIEVKVDIGSLPNLFISNVNLCTLLANLLDNSIEACNLFKKENPFMQIDIKIIKENLAINIKNSSNPVNVDKYGNYITNKKVGDHGLGILQINRVINQYEGFVSRKYENNVFETKILIFNDKK